MISYASLSALRQSSVPFGVGFDFDHTLGIDNKIERVAFMHLLDVLVSHGARRAGKAEESAAIDALLIEQRAGGCGIDAAVESFVRNHAGQVADFAQYVALYKETVLGTVDDFVVALPDARHVLDTLKARNVPMALLSNGWSPLQQRKAACVGFPGPILVSDEIGVQKPDWRAFAQMLDALKVPAHQAFYVGDNPVVDIGGCMDCGIKGVWLDAEAIPYPQALAPPSLTIHALSELLTALPGTVGMT